MDNLAFKDLDVVAYAGGPLRTEQGETLVLRPVKE